MSFLQTFESRFGLTRSDLTLSLFLLATALAGFVYTRFIESPASFRERTEFLTLARHADSLSRAKEQSAQLVSLWGTRSDTLTTWQPLSSQEMLEEGSDGAGSDELTLEDVAPIDPNTAPPPILQLLPGVGEKTALKIVAARPFDAIEDLLDVKGIGPAKLAKMRPYLRLRRSISSGVDSVPVNGRTESEVTRNSAPDVGAKQGLQTESNGREHEIVRSDVDSGTEQLRSTRATPPAVD